MQTPHDAHHDDADNDDVWLNFCNLCRELNTRDKVPGITDRDEIISVISRLPYPVYLVNTGKDITYSNPAALSAVGSSITKCRDILPDSEACGGCGLPDEQTSVKPDTSITDSVGMCRNRGLNIIPVSLDSGRVKEYILSTGGPLGRKKLDDGKKTMLSMISHDIKTPLSLLLMNADLLLEAGTVTDEDSRAMLEAIAKSARSASVMIDDLVILLSLEHGVMKLTPEPLPLGPVVSLALDALTGLARERSATIIMKIPDGLPPLMLDIERFGRVIVNVVSNALRHGQEGVKVQISAAMSSKEPGMAVVEIADDGPGIDAAELPGIMSGDAVRLRSRHARGHGFGLMVVRTITVLHGGRVEIESSESRGTTVRLVLPISPSTR